MGVAAPTYWTAEMVRQLPDDGNRYEVVHGELLVTPAPRFDHQLLVSWLAVAIAKYLEHVYWIVDGAEQRVEAWTSDSAFPVMETERLVWRPVGAGNVFTLELAELFRPV